MLTPVAIAIDRVGKTKLEKAWLLSHGWHETKYAYLVINNRCSEMPKGEQCDPKKGVAQSVGPWQVKPKWCRTDTSTLEGQAECVINQARFGKRRCNTWLGAFAAPIGSGACVSKKGPARVYMMNTLVKKMDHLRAIH
jgi:hypothetical protein